MNKGNLKVDPRGLIFESYRMEGISVQECRAIFLDWALGLASGDMETALGDLHDEYVAKSPDHPMSGLIKAGLNAEKTRQGRRGGRRGKLRNI